MKSSATTCILILAAGLLAGTSLAGCSASVDLGEPSAAPSSASRPAQAAEPSPKASGTPSEHGQATGTDGIAATNPATGPGHTDGSSDIRGELVAQTTTEVDCGVGELSPVGKKIHVTGDCDSLVIEGTGSLVVAQRIGDLRVSAVGATVLVTSASTITVDGTSATVVWETGNPQVFDTGLSNTIGPLSKVNPLENL